jgi:hypothetical protein
MNEQSDMNIEYDPENRLVVIDGEQYTSTFEMPFYLQHRISDTDWLSINQFLYSMYNWQIEDIVCSE